VGVGVGGCSLRTTGRYPASVATTAVCAGARQLPQINITNNTPPATIAAHPENRFLFFRSIIFPSRPFRQDRLVYLPVVRHFHLGLTIK
jgi:hypothetical protein